MTGALDTGIQFGPGKATLQIGPERFQEQLNAADDMKVCIVDAETRHLPPEEAYQTVYQLAVQARRAGVRFVYKKTDSALRGNVGSELAAVRAAYGAGMLHFVPAFPKMGRVTKDGIHYIDDCPVADSIFGQDPYEPVQVSRVDEILNRNWAVPVYLVSWETEPLPDGILAYDCTSDREMEQIVGKILQQPGPYLLAGCAGLASVLSRHLCTGEGNRVLPNLCRPLSVVCGSTNPITVEQVETACQLGAVHLRMRPEEKLDAQWLDTPAGEQRLAVWKRRMEESGCSVLESFSDPDGENFQAYVQSIGICKEEVRRRIADTLGAILRRLMDMGLDRTFLITGGDTLLAFLKQIKPENLSPICELLPGVVCLRMTYRSKIYMLLSKSGGFGDRNLVAQLQKIING